MTKAKAKVEITPSTIDRKALAVIVANIHKATKDAKDAWRRMISLEISAGHLWVRAGGEHAHIEIPIPCKGIGLTCTVDGEALHRALRSRFSDTPTLELELANGVLLLRDTQWIGSHRDCAERLLTRIPVATTCDDAKAAGTISGAALRHAAAIVNHARSLDETRPGMMGLQVRCSETGPVRLLTTDGHRLSIATVLPEWNTSADMDLCIPGDAAEMLALLPDGQITVYVTEQGIEIAQFENGPLTFQFTAAALPTGVMSYADQVIPAPDPARTVSLNSTEVSALKLAAKTAMKDPQAGVDLYFTDTGRERYSLTPPSIPSTCVRICARYLFQALECIHLSATIQYSDDLNPIVIRDARNPNHLEVIMPMRK